MSDPALLSAALKWHAAGAVVVPVRADGSKAPALARWRELAKGEEERPGTDQLHAWFPAGPGGYDGFGVLTGDISGNLELFELEGRGLGLLAALEDALAEEGHPGLLARISAGYSEWTPGGGLHLFLRTAEPTLPNTRLAMRPATAEELQANPADLHKTLIETRGQGGFVVLAPSGGRTHPTGRSWIAATGITPGAIVTVTEQERAALHACAAALDERRQAVAPAYEPPPRAPRPDGTLSPGDAYEAQTSWADILEPEGWRHYFTSDGPHGPIAHWTRPGKASGVSATTNANGTDRLYVHSSSTALEPGSHGKLGAYAALHHGGSLRAAVAHLGRSGYGPPPAAPQGQDAASLIAPGQRHLGVVQSDGSVAVKPAPAPKPAPSAAATEHGNAEAAAAEHAATLRYAPSRGQWLTWDGSRWRWCEDDAQPIRAMIGTVMQMDDPAHRHKSLSAKSLEASVRLLRRHDAIRVDADQLDAHPYLLNTPAGPVDLRTGRLGAPDAAQLHTKRTLIGPAATADAPQFARFLTQTFDGQPELAGYMQRLIGQAAIGEVLAHTVPFLHGRGANGKSVLMEIAETLLGDYGTTAPIGFLMAGTQKHETELARLHGIRFISISEVDQKAQFDEAKLKNLTGGEAITARYMRKDYFTFAPSHTLFLSGNHQPRVEAGGESFWRRLRLVPFLNIVPEEEREEGLARRLVREEGPAILRWIIDGAVAALNGGMREPEGVRAATAVYAAEEDSLGRFMADCCHLGGAPAVMTETGRVRAAYSAWARDQGEHELPMQTFGRELRARYGIQQHRSSGRRFYVGLALIDTRATEPDRRYPDS